MTGGSPSELAWSVLDVTSPILGELRVRESDITTTVGPVLHALDTSGRRHLLIPLAEGEPVTEDRASAGVQLVERTLIGDGDEQRFADVVCLLPHLERLFNAVADEILRTVPDYRGTAVEAAHRVLQRWRELLGRPTGTLLGPERLAGLLAELRWLERLAGHSPSTALKSWVGPDGARIDFMSGGRGVEVKATLAREGRSVEIHGDRQLEIPGEGDLHLLFIRFEISDGEGDTIPDIIDRLTGLGVDPLELHHRLARAGYAPTGAETYADLAFVSLEELIYPVDAAFPRIVPESFVGGHVPDRISSLRYTIDLAGEPPSPLTNSAASALALTLALATSPP